MQNNSGKKISNTIKVTAIQRTNRKKIEAALKQMERGLECNDRAAFLLEEVGLEPQAQALDGAAEPIDALRDMLAEL
jgi:hypothetical protein